MIALMLMAADALMQAPFAMNMQTWWTADDYPLQAQQRGTVGWVDYALTVSPEGKVISCAVELSSGSALLDQPTCDLAKKQARIKPALDANGKPILGVFRTRTTWSLPSGAMPRKPLYNQKVYTVQQLPGGVVNPSYVVLDVSVDAMGNIGDCIAGPADATVIPGKKVDFEKSASVLGGPACNFTRQQLKLAPAKDASGTPQPSVQQVTVIFTSSGG